MISKARDLATSGFIPVKAGDRPPDVQAPPIGGKRVCFAVFDGPRFLGVVKPGLLLHHAGETFGDLIRIGACPCVPEGTQLDRILDEMESAETDTVAVVGDDGQFVGCVSYRGIVEFLLRETLEMVSALALAQATLDLTQERSLPIVLQKTVDVARKLTAARYGALLVVGEHGGTTQLLTSGVDEATRAAIGRMPAGEGLLGAVLQDPVPLRLEDMARDPRSRGFPPNHPPMQSLLAAPILTEHRVIGILYLAEKPGAEPFSQADEDLLVALARHAATAIENARISEQAQRQAQLLERRVAERTEELLRASQHKSEFLANMSHELRTPLHSILGFAEILLADRFGPLGEPHREFVAEIRESGTHLLGLINDVLDLARVEAGRLILSPEHFSLTDALAAAEGTVAILAQQQGLTLQRALEPGLSLAWADPARFRQILINLLSNAVKFTPQGGRVTIGARMRIADCGLRIADLPEAEGGGRRAERGEGIAECGLRIADFPEGDGKVGIAEYGRPRAERGEGIAECGLRIADFSEENGQAGRAESSGSGGAPRAVPYSPFPVPQSPFPNPQSAIPNPQSAMPGAEGDTRDAETQGRGDAGASGEWIEISVTDTGFGIAPEDQARIFEAFEQVATPGFGRPEGTGLGLALTKRLVELHGGRIWVESAGLGHGATFTFTLPWRPPASGRRILIVDDEPNLRRGLRDHLTAEGYTVDEAAGGHEALAAVASRPPDLVLLDVGLPDLHGRQVLASLRRNPATAQIPVVILTGLADVRAEDLLAEGANEFLTKPFSLSVLSSVIRRFLEPS